VNNQYPNTENQPIPGTSMSVFEQDTAIISTAEPHHYTAQLSERWTIGSICNGGYLMAIGAKAMAMSTSQPHPLSITAYYLDKSEPGPISIVVDPIQERRSSSTVAAKIIQNGTERVRFLASYTNFDKTTGDTYIENAPPSLPPLDQCLQLHKPRVEINNRIALYLPPNYIENLGKTNNQSEITGWVKLKEGGTLDLYSLILFSDALPPPIFNRIGPVGWVPTIELTVHLRAIPKPGILKCRFKTRYLTNGIVEEDGDIWDSEDNLVAISRQMAKCRPPTRNKQK